ncbi:MAG TPA: hypothetical protein VFI84_02745 [Candidatus Saccharimonadales bacterium]|nr:hypothetical protein [Candidatus Saccharimonadales bacterium]
MQIRSKPQELIDAQLAVYADQYPAPNHEARNDVLLNQLANYALQGSLPDRVTVENIGFRPKHNLLTGVEPLFDKEEYLALIRSTSKKELVALSEMIANYDKMQSQITATSICADISKARLHSDYLGEGRHNMAFSQRLTIGDTTKDAVVIIPKPNPDWSDKSRINERAVALSKVKGLPGIEQGIAVSYNPAVLVVEKAAGKPIKQMAGPERRAIPYKHWQDLAENVRTLEGRVSIDENPDNFLYDPESGFKVIDIVRSFNSIDNANAGNIGIVERIQRQFSS